MKRSEFCLLKIIALNIVLCYHLFKGRLNPSIAHDLEFELKQITAYRWPFETMDCFNSALLQFKPLEFPHSAISGAGSGLV